MKEGAKMSKAGANFNDIKAMLLDKGYNWDTLPPEAQHGTCCYKTEDGWFIDSNMPVLKGEGRALLDNIIL